jgi:hypothetical protein
MGVRYSISQLVQESRTGLVVAVPPPAVAITPVSDGMEKYVFSQAAGAATVMLASASSSIVKVAFAPTTTGVVKVCALPLELVAKLQYTNDVLEVHPAWGVVSPMFEYPVA